MAISYEGGSIITSEKLLDADCTLKVFVEKFPLSSAIGTTAISYVEFPCRGGALGTSMGFSLYVVCIGAVYNSLGTPPGQNPLAFNSMQVKIKSKTTNGLNKHSTIVDSSVITLKCTQ